MAIRAGLDLAKLIPWVGALILATLAYYIVKPLVDALDVGILGVHPFRSIGNALESGIVDPLNDLRSKSDAEIAKALSSLVDNLGVALGLVLVFGILVKAALQYMWNHALRPFIRVITDPISDVASYAKAHVIALASTVAGNAVAAEQYARTVADRAFADAVTRAREEIGTAKAEAIAYADSAVSTLRNAENAAIADVAKAVQLARVAGEAAAADALRQAERDVAAASQVAGVEIASAQAKAEAVAANALAASDTLAADALAKVKAIAIGAEDALETTVIKIGDIGYAGLIAAVPALATVVAIALTEAGLDSQACRAKNKQICGTDTARWTQLLEGLATAGLAFSLADLVKVAEPIVSELAPVIAQAA